MKLTGIRAAIIDLDGTLLHTAPDFQVAINRMRAELQLAPLAIEQIVRYVGRGSENLVRQILKEDFPSAEVEARFDAALASYLQHYSVVNGDQATLYPDVIAGLQAMQNSGLKLACVTNKPYAFALTLLRKTGLHEYFDIIYGGDSFARKKPDPQPFLQVFNNFDLSPNQVVAIGDSSNDAEAARAAGCHVLIVPYGYNHHEPVEQIDADGIVKTLLDAAHLIADFE